MTELCEKVWHIVPGNGHRLERLIINLKMGQVKEIWFKEQNGKKATKAITSEKGDKAMKAMKSKQNKKAMKAMKSGKGDKGRKAMKSMKATMKVAKRKR